MQDNTMTNLPQGWEKFNFDNIFYSPSSKNYQLNTKDYLDKGCIPIIDQSKKFIIGYSNNYEKIFKINNCNNSCIIFGDHTRVLKFIDFDFIVGADGVKILLNKDIERFNTKFLFFQLLYKDIPLLGYRRHFSVLKQNTFIIPPLKEQERIVGILDESFANIDESIKNLEQDLLNLDELMQSALQKAFNPLKDNAKENYQLPQGWEWKSLNSVVLKTSNINPCNFNEDKFYYIDISSIDNKNFCIYNIKNIYKQDAPSRARKDVLYGDVLYATTRPNLKNIAINYYNFNNIVASTGFCILRANEKLNNKYLFFFLLSDIFDNYINKYIRGAQYPSVSDKDIFNSKIPLPPLQEQEQIASYLDELSLNIKDLKQNYQAQIKNLQELKKSLLDRAFKGRL
ncbi:restriction endonuclease subunit S [Campylobacter volucris]|uniref:restriction endonuclease subunit S n=1 Tax=Campylobacter volucris TaxID=1031542 RepID=UPI00189DBB6B|nr:restriction endonuclease subunit S [Campylobacter volucris]MBF7046434.1 restriction endonuclease subunit S [Campylobacter volucris]